MRNNFHALNLAGLAAALCIFSASAGNASADETSDLVARGEYVARAADCSACHAVPEGGKPYAGGYAISSPLGTIFSTNITPSKAFGIGNWTEEEFTRAVREGVLPSGEHLYPAMPYDAYSGITDADMKALYAYFMHKVEPVDEAPKERTQLEFPFSQRWLMAGWNLLFAGGDRFTPKPTEEPRLARGRYLVDVLGHCSSCHTPRNLFMANDSGSYLSGAELGGWFAPNITSDKNSGIGGWTDKEIVTFLRDGHVEGKGVAAGAMAEAVEHSLRFLQEDDLSAIAAYLKSVPAKTDSAQKRPAFDYGTPAAEHYDFVDKEAQTMLSKLRAGSDELLSDMKSRAAYKDVGNPALLYDSACASCHQPTGSGTADGYYPSLYHSTATGSANGQNLVMTILEGVHREGGDGKISMPAFKDDLTDTQVASLASFVAQSFGNPDLKVAPEDVALWRAGGSPPLIAKLGRLAGPAAMLIAILVILAGVAYLALRGRRRDAKA